jgi:lysozyme
MTMTLNQPDCCVALPPAVAVAMPLVKEFEGCQLEAFPDPRTGGELWRIGWGCIHLGDGRPVRAGDRISQAQADAVLKVQLVTALQCLACGIGGWQQLNVNEQAALLSFTDDVGMRWYRHPAFASLSKCLHTGLQIDARILEAVPAAMMLYVAQGSPCEAQLRRRRKAEGALWRA